LREAGDRGFEESRKFGDVGRTDLGAWVLFRDAGIVGQSRSQSLGTANAVCHQEIALGTICPKLRGLPRLDSTDVVIHVVVEIADGNQPIFITVGITGAKPSDNGVREHRDQAPAYCLATFESVFRTTRSRENYPATPTRLETLLQVQAGVAFGISGECATVTAVENYYLAARTAVFQSFVEPGGSDGCGSKLPALRVSSRVVEPAVGIKHAMA
jgi:hypothetical protein